MNTNETEDSTKGALGEAGVMVKLGMDVHAEQITAVKQVEGKVAQPPYRTTATGVVEQVREWVSKGERVYTCYEAGPCGYGLHRGLTQVGATNYVVAPQRWDDRGQRVKTDRRDARQLCQRLDRFLSGVPDAFSVVTVPTVEQEQRRALTRHRGAILKERNRCLVRARSLLLAQGVRFADQSWWHPQRWNEHASDLPGWLREQVQLWRDQAWRLDQQLGNVTSQVEQLSEGILLPKGLGRLTHALMSQEVLDWNRFRNRGQVSSYTGLCPSEASTGTRRRQGAINKCGNPRLRHCLVEAVWRLLYWQPHYKPLEPVRRAGSPRQRKRLIVAAARRLAVDLWRLNTGQCTAEQLGLITEQD